MIRYIDRADEIDENTLLGISTSIKPGVGQQGRSATRSILVYALDSIGKVYSDVAILDLRTFPLPLFDGRSTERYDNPNVALYSESISRAGSILFSIPAYWCGVSGVFKNLVDVLCGPSYINASSQTLFSQKIIGMILVGADEASSISGARQAGEILISTGATVVREPVVVCNSSFGSACDETLSADLLALGGQLILYAAKNRNLQAG